MSIPTVPNERRTEFDDELDRLETSIRQLKIEYDRFLAGGLKHEPIQLRFRIQKIVKKYGDARNIKYHHRYRFNGLVHRFVTMQELWGKRVLKREQGPSRVPRRLDKKAERCVAVCRIQDAEGDAEALRKLYDQWVKERERQGEGPRRLSFKKFVRGISSQTAKLRNEADCGEIELRLIVSDQKVQLRALRA